MRLAGFEELGPVTTNFALFVPVSDRRFERRHFLPLLLRQPSSLASKHRLLKITHALKGTLRGTAELRYEHQEDLRDDYSTSTLSF